MSHLSSRVESEEVVAKRKQYFDLIAKKHQQRLKKVQEEPIKENILDLKNPWLTGVKKDRWEEAQMAYVKPYVAQYEVTSSLDQNDANGQENTSETASIVSDNDTLTSLRSVRTRFKTRMSARASVANFEQTSTIQAPSELDNPSEYTSNIDVNELKKQYFRNYKMNKDLPIHDQRTYLINSINSYSVVMVSGATGCGKTTQVPCYILEHAILSDKQARAPMIYVTQPRRIAARSIAKRVCDEHNWNLGDVVGYQVGLDKKVGPSTVLIFCTAGVLLQKLINEKSLKSYTHIIVDEAHERDSDTDLLMMFIRLLMQKEPSFFRLIVMSATMEMSKLQEYFSFRTTYGHRSVTTPSIVKIGARETNNVKIHYLDIIKSTYGIDFVIPEFNLEQPELHEDCLKAAYKIIVDVIPHVDTFSAATESTLVFLPGLAEITKLHNMLKRAQDHLDIIPLHSCLSPLDHDRVFRDSEAGRRKVILATNIAESSITVKDVGFVIDFCLTKALMKDQITNFPALTLQWSTKDKSIQRAGRTGRCCTGKVFRMVTKKFYETFDTYARPELLTAPLELSVLRVKSFQMGEVKALLALVLSPPKISDIKSAVLELKQIGALSSTYERKISSIDGDLTELGRVIAALPIDVHLSKLIVLASVLDVLEDAIIVAACLSTNRTVVKHLYDNQPETYRMKLDWAKGSCSDLFVSLDVYKEYMEQRDKRKDLAFLVNYCNNKHLDERKLHEVSSLVEELKHRLEGVNITVLEQPNRVRNAYEDELMLKIAFCASFYPNYFLTKDVTKESINEIEKELLGLDPTKTLVVSGIPQNQVPLYRTQILSQVTGLRGGERSRQPRVILENDVEYIADNGARAYLVFSDKNKMLSDESSKRAIGVDGIIQPSRDIDRSIFMALKMSHFDRYYVREYKALVGEERMRYYNSRYEQISLGERLKPSLKKLVVGRPINNDRLTDTDDLEFNKIMKESFYVEVEFDQEQDDMDLNELARLEMTEKSFENISETSRLRMKNLSKEINSHIFKPEKKFIKGPYSPIQMGFRSILYKSRSYTVEVDRLSVNSILLNTNYNEQRRQMLVAAAVSHQNSSNRINAIDTTLMPNIRGLPTLMALLFAQYYRIVYDNSMNCVAGAIFGLGWDENDTPIDRFHEVELGFDILITNEDIRLINKAREKISELIRFIDIQNPGAPRAQLQQTVREILLNLIKRRRYPLEEANVANIKWDGTETYIRDKHNVPKDQLTRLEEGKTRIFLPVMEVTKELSDFDMYKAIRANLEFMCAIERCDVTPPKEPTVCLLCGRENSYLLYTDIVNHINDEAHIQRLEMFEIWEERAKMRLNLDRSSI